MPLFSISRRADYALVFLAELMQASEGKYLTLNELSKKGLPQAFLAKIGKNLVDAGIIGSQEGRAGGYYLKKDPSQVTVREALEAVEGEILIAQCMVDVNKCPRVQFCRQRRFMLSLNDHIKSVLEVYTLRDLSL